MSLENKVAIVAGGGRDIGRAVSVALAASGAKVVVNYFNNEEEGKATAAAIKEAGGEAIVVAGDMTKQEDVDTLVVRVGDKQPSGSVDVGVEWDVELARVLAPAAHGSYVEVPGQGQEHFLREGR